MKGKRHFWIVACCLSALFIACDKHSSSTSKPVDNGPFNAGRAVYDSVEANAKESVNGGQKVTVLRSASEFSEETQATHREQIIDGINTVFDGRDATLPNAGRESRDNAPAIRTIYDLVRDNSLPDLTDTLGKMLQEIAADETNIRTITDFLNIRCGLDPRGHVMLLRKILLYPKCEELFKANASLIKKDPELLKTLFQVMSDLLTNLPADDATAILLQVLVQKMKVEPEGVLGSPVWLSKLDENGNPTVMFDDATEEIYPPFVDKNGDGICDVDAAKKPIDKSGRVLDIPAFGKKNYADGDGKVLITRDAAGRAIAPDGKPVFEYYNAKETVWGFLLYNVGEVFAKQLIQDSAKFSARAFLPKKLYQDESGLYTGFSDAGDCLNAASGALDLMKKESTLHLARGFSALIYQKPQTARKFLSGFGKMLILMREEELSDPDKLIEFMVMAILGGVIPEIKEAIDEMADVEIPDLGIPMHIYFMTWMGENIEDLGRHSMWPLRSVLRQVKREYPQDPALTERLLANLLDWALGNPAAQNGRQLTPVLPILLELAVHLIAENPDANVEYVKQAVKHAVTGRAFAKGIECYEAMGEMEEVKTIMDALSYYLTPQSDPHYDVYGDLCCMVGIFESKQDLQAKIRLLNMVGRFLDPKRPLVVNLIQVLGRLISVDNSQLCVRSMRAAVSECRKYGFEPVTMFVHATVAVYRIDYAGNHSKDVLVEDVRNMLVDIHSMLLDPEGLLQKIYTVLRGKK